MKKVKNMKKKAGSTEARVLHYIKVYITLKFPKL